MEEQDLDWVIRDLNRLKSARAREHRARGAGSHTSMYLDEAIKSMETLLSFLAARFNVKVDVKIRETTRGVFDGEPADNQ